MFSELTSILPARNPIRCYSERKVGLTKSALNTEDWPRPGRVGMIGLGQLGQAVPGRDVRHEDSCNTCEATGNKNVFLALPSVDASGCNEWESASFGVKG